MRSIKRPLSQHQKGILGLSKTSENPVHPYSKIFNRGAVGSLGQIDGRSAQGRLIRRIELGLIALLGDDVNIAQHLLIERICKMRLQLDALDLKLAKGKWTPHDQRTFGGLSNAYRLAIVSVEKMKINGKAVSVEDVLAAHRKREKGE